MAKAKSSIRINAKEKKDGVVLVKALMTHPMQTGGSKDKKTGKPIPAHFIEEVTCTHKGETLISADWSAGLSKNPYISFKFSGGAKGEEIELTWKDNTGKSDSLIRKIK